jgi:phage protein U
MAGNIERVVTRNIAAGETLSIVSSMGVTKLSVIGTNADDITVTGKTFNGETGDAIILNNTLPALTIQGNPVSVLDGVDITSPTTGTASVILIV